MITLHFSTLSAFVGNPTQEYYVPVYKTGQSYDEHEKDKDPDTKRQPRRINQCVISHYSGVDITGCDEPIVSYEVWDVEGDVCLGAYSDESDFIDSFFSMTGELQVRFQTETYTYVGTLCM